jgi:hypothetical protein
MKLKMITMLLLTLTTFSSAAMAGQGRGRIDMYVKNGELKFHAEESGKFKMSPAHWIKEEEAKKRYLTSDLKVSDEQWTEVKFVISCTEDTDLKIALRGQWDKTMRNWTYFDDVSAIGASIKNPGFEEQGGWKFDKSQQVLDESLAHSGKGAVLVWHDKEASQFVRLKADEKVTITAWVKFCKQEPKESK